MTNKNKTPLSKQGGARSASRLGAVQALYQMEINDESARNVVAEFINYRLGKIIDDDQYADADKDFFSNIVHGVEERMAAIDVLVAASLSDTWTLDRIEPVARAILRTGVYELMVLPDIPTAVIINEYVDVAKAFFDDNKPGFINGVLDKISKTVRK